MDNKPKFIAMHAKSLQWNKIYWKSKTDGFALHVILVFTLHVPASFDTDSEENDAYTTRLPTLHT